MKEIKIFKKVSIVGILVILIASAVILVNLSLVVLF